jgi:cytoskeletal protein CcmA (bactofilin family)
MPLRLIGGRDGTDPGAKQAARPSQPPGPPPDAGVVRAAPDPARASAPVIVVPRPPAQQPAAKRGATVAPDQAIIGPHITVDGHLRGGDDIVIRGVVHGNIRGRRVEIRRGARVEGDIVAAEAIIAGAVRGNVEAQRIEVSRGGGVEGRLENDGNCEINGEVEGDINSRELTIRIGAQVNSVITADRARIAGTLTGVIEAGDVVIDESSRVSGEIDSDGQVDIAGHVQGMVRARRINIREGASVADNIYAEEITIAGTAMGEMMAVSVAIAATAHVDAQIIHHQIEIAQGAVVKGSRPWRPKQYLHRRDRAGTGDFPE